jgi:protein TonB
MSRLSTASDRGLFSGSLALSLGLHAALAALVLLGISWRPPAPPPVLTVSLVAPPATRPGPGGSPGPAGTPKAKKASPGAPPAALAQPAAPPAKPKPVKRKKQRAAPVSRPRPEMVRPAPPPRPTPPPVAQTPTPPRPASRPPASPHSSPVQASGSATGGQGRTAGTAPAGAGSGTARSAVLGYGHGGRGGGDPAATQRHYLKLIRARILAQRKYPYMARQRRQEGVVRLRFTLSAAGALSQGVQVVKPSGFNLLDEQARQCVLAAAPFPPFPLGLQRQRLCVELPIIYKISEQER